MRPSRNRYFIDESGQFAPRDGDIAVMVILLVPEEESALAALHNFVGKWRRRFAVNGKIKTKNIPPAERVALARLIKERRWLVFYERVRLAKELDDEFKMLLKNAIESARKKLDFARRADLRIDFLMAQIDRMTHDQCYWYMILTKLLGLLCSEGERQGLCPIGTFVMDEKLPITANELAGFLIRSGVMTRFPKIFGKNLGLVLGVNEHDEWFDVRVSTDDKEDGLVLADVCAATLGQLTREGDDAPWEVRQFHQILTAVR